MPKVHDLSRSTEFQVVTCTTTSDYISGRLHLISSYVRNFTDLLEGRVGHQLQETGEDLLKVRKNSVATPHALEFHIVSHSFTT